MMFPLLTFYYFVFAVVVVATSNVILVDATDRMSNTIHSTADEMVTANVAQSARNTRFTEPDDNVMDKMSGTASYQDSPSDKIVTNTAQTASNTRTTEPSKTGKTGRQGKISLNDNNKGDDSIPLEKPQKVLLVSVDGYRWDLHKLFDTPNIARVLRNGVTVDHVLNVFPTKTLPNHHSIVTGLYPEHHGMVDNAFIDKSTGKWFDLEDPNCMGRNATSWWNQSLPLWIEVEQKTKYKSGNMFWPGYKVPYVASSKEQQQSSSIRKKQTSTYMPPAKLQKTFKSLRGDKRNATMYWVLQKALKWLAQDDVIFVPLYSMEPDSTLHEYGVEHENMVDQVKTLDEFVGTIFDSVIQDRMLRDNVNVIFIGDHGHVTTSSDRQIDLSKYINIKQDVKAVLGFTNVFLYTKPGKKVKVYEQLKKASEKSTLFRVFLKEEIPPYLHIRNNSRTGDILILPEPGWIVVDKKALPPYLKADDWVRSEHGYDSMDRDMNPGFFAFGPAFKRGFKKFCIETVDLYGLMSTIMDIEPSPNDGRFSRVAPLLKGKNINDAGGDSGKKKIKTIKDKVTSDNENETGDSPSKKNIKEKNKHFHTNDEMSEETPPIVCE